MTERSHRSPSPNPVGTGLDLVEAAGAAQGAKWLQRVDIVNGQVTLKTADDKSAVRRDRDGSQEGSIAIGNPLDRPDGRARPPIDNGHPSGRDDRGPVTGTSLPAGVP